MSSPTKTVWKFEIPSETWWSGPFVLQPRNPVVITKIVNAEVVHAGGDLLIWAEVLPHVPAPVRENLVIHGTGHPIPLEEDHLLTFREGIYVWHLYRIPSHLGEVMELGGPSR